MPLTYQLITSNTLSATTASVVFSSIPATYTDLLVKISGRSDNANWQNAQIQVNSLTATYTDTVMWGTGAAVSGTNTGGNATVYRALFAVPSTAISASLFGMAEFYIPNYATAIGKPAFYFSVGEDAAATGYNSVGALYLNSTATMSSLTLTPGAGSWVSGTTMYLYGIKNS